MKERDMSTVVLISFTMSLVIGSSIMLLHLTLEDHPEGEWQDYNCTTVEWCQWQCQNNGTRETCKSGIPLCVAGYNVTTCTQQIFVRAKK